VRFFCVTYQRHAFRLGAVGRGGSRAQNSLFVRGRDDVSAY